MYMYTKELSSKIKVIIAAFNLIEILNGWRL
jgi:hypothetical protein